MVDLDKIQHLKCYIDGFWMAYFVLICLNSFDKNN